MEKGSVIARLHSESLEHLRFGDKFFAAIAANAAHQTLRATHQNRTRDEERLNAHVVQTRDGTGRIIRVQSAQDLVTGQGRFHGNVSSFVVTNFTDHHDVRILPKDGAKGRREIESNIVAHRHLVHAHQFVLDRVFHRHDVIHRAV